MLESAVLGVHGSGNTWIYLFSPQSQAVSPAFPVYSDASHCLEVQLAPQMEKVRQECQEAYLIEKES